MKNKRTTIFLIFSVLVTLIVVAAFAFFLRVIKNKNEHASVVIATLEDKMRQKENTELFAEKFEEIKSLENDIMSHFVDPNKIDEFVSYLEDLGEITGASISVEGIDVPEDNKGMIDFKLSIEGSFQAVSRTITLLENIPYQVNVNQVYLNKDIEQIKDGNEIKISSTSTWQADVSFSILSLN